MKLSLDRIAYLFSKVDRRTIQVALIVLTLTLFVLAAGAPDCGGGVGWR